MKKKIAILILAAVILIVGGAVWYNAPINLINLDADDVLEIVVLNGATGNTTHIDDEEQIRYIIENLNDVVVKRSKLSVGYVGYSFRVTIYLVGGDEADGRNNFIVNSEYSVRKDPFFYTVTEGEIDYAYINDIVE